MSRIISYNVNGIRAAIGKGFDKWLNSMQPGIICIQETKASSGQVDESIFVRLGYHAFWNSAEKKGYSGVLILSKMKPLRVSYGMGIAKFDSEGRIIRADFEDFSLVCVYVPSGTTGDIRQNFKMEFLEAFHSYILNIKKAVPQLVVCGDFNICHREIDINHPEKHHKMSGFLPEEREWIGGFIESGLTDSFRKFDSRPEQYSWWSYRAGSRVKNLGWRIDYHFVSEALDRKLVNAGIMPDVFHSDHCPVYIDLDMSTQ